MTDRCSSCAEHHHQGCYATAAGGRGPNVCQCPCRPIRWRT